MYTLITDADESLRVLECLMHILETNAEGIPAQIGYQGGMKDCILDWRPNDGFWFYGEPYSNRFWCAYGLGKPRVGAMHNIVVEINPSMEGVNRQVAGVFFRDERGSVFLGHTGRVGGGKPGIGRDAFLSFSNARLTEINAPDGKPLAAILIGEIGAPEFCQKLCSFIKKVAEFKGTIS